MNLRAVTFGGLLLAAAATVALAPAPAEARGFVSFGFGDRRALPGVSVELDDRRTRAADLRHGVPAAGWDLAHHQLRR
jgi:hypothetical protein